MFYKTALGGAGKATLVIPVVGLDILNKRLTDEFVHRPE